MRLGKAFLYSSPWPSFRGWVTIRTPWPTAAKMPGEQLVKRHPTHGRTKLPMRAHLVLDGQHAASRTEYSTGQVHGRHRHRALATRSGRPRAGRGCCR